jgi:hypothetical protein
MHTGAASHCSAWLQGLLLVGGAVPKAPATFLVLELAAMVKKWQSSRRDAAIGFATLHYAALYCAEVQLTGSLPGPGSPQDAPVLLAAHPWHSALLLTRPAGRQVKRSCWRFKLSCRPPAARAWRCQFCPAHKSAAKDI